MSNTLLLARRSHTHALMLAGCLFLGMAAAGCGGGQNVPASTEASMSDNASARQMAVSLEDTAWVLVRIQGHEVTVAPDQRTPYFKLLPEEGRIVGIGGCNQFGGRYTVEGDSLHVEKLVSTQMACAEGMATEQAFLNALNTATTYRIDDGRLLLYRGEERLAVFEARTVKE